MANYDDGFDRQVSNMRQKDLVLSTNEVVY